MVTKVSIELKRQKIIALSHIGREMVLMLNIRNDGANRHKHNHQQMPQQVYRAMEYNQHNGYTRRPLDLRTNVYN